MSERLPIPDGFVSVELFNLERETHDRIRTDNDALRAELEKAQSEREKIAQWMIANSLATGHGDTLDDLLDEATWQIAALRTRKTPATTALVNLSKALLDDANAECATLHDALEELTNYMEAEHGPGQPGSMLHRARTALNSSASAIVKSSQPIDVIDP